MWKKIAYIAWLILIVCVSWTTAYSAQYAHYDTDYDPVFKGTRGGVSVWFVDGGSSCVYHVSNTGVSGIPTEGTQMVYSGVSRTYISTILTDIDEVHLITGSTI
ncbi:unnamed protein product [marine sediment metagenome]|uniref:Uncharacterized protein n=1 Tax=marine sediment metagenome TaxID=412755 RepID=X1DCT0_9ZZZZ